VNVSFTDASLSDAQAKMASDAFANGHAVVKAKLVMNTTKDPISISFPVLRATEVYVGQTGHEVRDIDSFYQVQQRLMLCHDCATVAQTLVNKNTLSMVKDVDFSATGADTGAVSDAHGAMLRGEIIIAGIDRGVVGAPMTLVADEFYTKLVQLDVPPPQTCGGFAGITCPGGFRCDFGGGAVHPDQTGTCVKAVPCGGIAGLTCADGFVCDMGTGPSFPDKSGVCVRPVK
jgi:hypothetical protein